MKTIAVLFFLQLSLIVVSAQNTGFMFRRVLDTPYPRHSGTAGGDMVVADFNGDSRLDIIVTGLQNTSKITWIYYQNSTGGFESPVQTEHGLPALDRGAVIRAADMNNDGKTDIVAYGRTGVAMQTSLFNVYLNNGNGVFSLSCKLGDLLPSEDFADVSGSWGKAGNQPDNKTDSEVKGLYNAQGWSKGVLELIDVNRDGLIDILFAGTKGTESGTDAAGQMIQRDWETSGVFINRGNRNFNYFSSAGYPQAGVPANCENSPERSYPGIAKVSRGFSASADFNNDGLIDVVVFGQANIGQLANGGIPETQRNGLPISEVYLQNGDGTFRVSDRTGLPALIDGSVITADFNSDGNADIILMGNSGHPSAPAGGRVTQIYHGKGDGTFVLDSNQSYGPVPNSAAGLVQMMSGDLGCGDLDGDGDIDLAAIGNANDKALYVYENINGIYNIVHLDKMRNGIGSNSISGTAQSDASNEGDLWVGDIDGDGDCDIIVNGRGGSFQLLVFANKKND